MNQAVWALLLRVWRHRPDRQRDPVELLDPRIASELLGYQYEMFPTIPPWPPGQSSPIGGMVDPTRKLIAVSEQWGPAYMRFTGAHELGHVCLHQPTMQMRDAPIDGPRPARTPKEREADWFATEFLMPPNLVPARFAAIFGDPPLTVNDHMAFHLDPQNHEDILRSEPGSLAREFAIATCRRTIHGQLTVPLHEQFKVSAKAMAIRIRELRLVSG